MLTLDGFALPSMTPRIVLPFASKSLKSTSSFNPLIIPIRINWPPACIELTPASMIDNTPVVSILKFVPSGTISLIAVSKSDLSSMNADVSIVCVAPHSFAISSLDCTRSTAMMIFALRIFAACTLNQQTLPSTRMGTLTYDHSQHPNTP